MNSILKSTNPFQICKKSARFFVERLLGSGIDFPQPCV